MDLLLAGISAIAGLVLGSFLNVCISRLPRDQSIVSPGSHCPRCGASIPWYRNIPILSFVLLGGRCADCRQPISPRYPAVELLTAALFVACFSKFGWSAAFIKSSIFSFLLVGLIFMDAETGLLPAEFTYPGIAFGLLGAWLMPGDSSGTQFLARLLGVQLDLAVRQLSSLDAVIAASFGAAFFYVIWAAYYLVRKRHGLGFGDIALIAMCGAFLGLKLTLFVLFTAPIAGAIYAIGLLLRNAMRPRRPASDHGPRLSTGEMLRAQEVPFGVFLGACSLLAVFCGEAAWNVYLGWINVP